MFYSLTFICFLLSTNTVGQEPEAHELTGQKPWRQWFTPFYYFSPEQLNAPMGNYSETSTFSTEEGSIDPANPFSDIRDRVMQVVPELLLPHSDQNFYTKAVVSPDGRFLYLTTLKIDTLGVWKRDWHNGYLFHSIFSYYFGHTYNLFQPGNLAVSPDGKHLYVFSASTLWVYDRDQYRGSLSNKRTVLTLDSCCDYPPMGVVLSSDGRRVYITDSCHPDLLEFDRNADTGSLSHRRFYDPRKRNLSGPVGAKEIKRPRLILWSKDDSHLYVTNDERESLPSLILYDVNVTEGSLSKPYIYEDGTNKVMCPAETPPHEWDRHVYPCKKEKIPQTDLGSRVNPVPHRLYNVQGIVQSSNGRNLYLISKDGALSIYDIDAVNGSLSNLKVLEHGKIGHVVKFVLSLDGTLLFILSKNRINSTLELWVYDVNTHDGSLSDFRIYQQQDLTTLNTIKPMNARYNNACVEVLTIMIIVKYIPGLLRAPAPQW